MRVKNILIAASIFLNIGLGLVVYKELSKPDAGEVGLIFKEAVRTENDQQARTLMAEGRKAKISDELLQQMKVRMSSGTSFNTYELLKFENGEMVLLHLTPDDRYEIQDVMIVPEEMRGVFDGDVH
ncbi:MULTISPECIES: hypothetical protein [Bacillus]|uniref:hypothetical protein n=1 Tax=Bacillus TaxID=1386 RepID=UPI0020A0E132|nr:MULTISPECIES: hypothetical protein [Bacillus]MCP1157117.1 hypothetical protein [Bacillus infantis]MDT0162974.1 hypothetical protein [Bacillus sp. AG4(2022)]